MSFQFPSSPEKNAPNLDWAPFGVVMFEVGAPFRGASKEFPQAIDERLFAHLALACSRELAMAPKMSEILPVGVWRAWMEKTGAKSGVWRLLDLVESPVGIVPVALVEARLPLTADTAEEASDAIAEWARRGQEERVPELMRSFLLPRFSRLIGMQTGATSADGRPARAVIGQMISEREARALRQELAEPFSSTGGGAVRVVSAAGGVASAVSTPAHLMRGHGGSQPVGAPAPEGWDDGEEDESDMHEHHSVKPLGQSTPERASDEAQPQATEPTKIAPTADSAPDAGAGSKPRRL